MTDIEAGNNKRDWASEIADILVQLSGVLETLDGRAWQSPSLCGGWSIRDVAGHIVWRIGTSTRDMLISGSKAYFGKHLNPMRAMDDLGAQAALAEPAELVREIRHIAALKLGGAGRTGLSELAEAFVHAYDILQPLGVEIEVAAPVTQAIARGRLPLAGRTVRDVVRQHTLQATDAGWQIGHGPVIEGTAAAIVLFLYGRASLGK